VLWLLALCAGLFLLAWTMAPDGARARDIFGEISLALVSLISGGAMLAWFSTKRSWEGVLPYAVAMLALCVAMVIDLIADIGAPTVTANRSTDLVFLIIGALFLIPARLQFHDHFDKEDRREIAADVALIAVALIAIIYLLLRPGDPSQEIAALIWSAIFAATAVAAITSFAALALWLPTAKHVGQLFAVGVFAGATLTVGSAWINGENPWGDPRLEIPLGLAALFLAGLMISDLRQGDHHVTRAGWGRPVLTASSVVAGAVSLAAIAALETRNMASFPESSALIVLMAIAVAGRILVNQVRSQRSADEVRSALVQKEAALEEADHAMLQLRKAIDTVAESEERLRILFDAAVDGIVEIDHEGIIISANEAFCVMVGLDRDFAVGRSWQAAAAAAGGGSASSAGKGEPLAALPETGQATLLREGHEMFLEARTSTTPGNPPGRLLLVRDVTAAKVADQTIRSLFKFLQDRDEDRTRLLKRSNSAIETERNRVARDLHDGPVQGVSAASLSVEAVLLMLQANDIDKAVDTLVTVRGQLSEEADNLRRLMSNMRPPILEERGLVPALKETLARFGKEQAIRTEFRSRSLVEVPADLETLAYRLVQEALTNARKHANARQVTLTVDAVAGQLRVEITDDGDGFDPSKARDYLRAGKVGLASMRERIELANGTFMVRSTEDSGTTIVATFPLDTVSAFASGWEQGASV